MRTRRIGSKRRRFFPSAGKRCARLAGPGRRRRQCARSRGDHLTAPHVARVTVVQQRIVVPRWKRAAAPRASTQDRPLSRCASARRVRARCATYLAAIMGIAKQAAARHHRGCRRRLRAENAAPIPNIRRCSWPRKKFGRKVHWMSSRSEAFNSDNQARDNVTDARTRARRERQVSRAARAPDAKSRRLCRVRRHPACDQQFRALLSGDVRHPESSISRVQCVYTNTLPTGPYRGAGRPEANYVIERLVDEAARVTGIDASTMRKRNLIPSSAMPYKTARRRHIRQRRIRGRSSTRRWRLPTVTNSSSAGARRKRGQAARLRHFLLSRTFRRHAERGRAARLSRQGHADRRPRRAVDRPGSRHGVSAARRATSSASTRRR